MTFSHGTDGKAHTTRVELLKNPRPDLPFASAALVGDWIILSGELGVSSSGELVSGLAEQTRVALTNIENTLGRVGCDRSDIVKCTIMLKDIARWAEFNHAYLKFFDAHALPARSAFGTNGLAFDAEVEIECLAVRRDNPGARDMLSPATSGIGPF